MATLTKTQIDKINLINNLTDNETIKGLCNEILYIDACNTTVKNSRFDIYKYVGKDKARERLQGVYYNNGDIVATDSYLLVVLQNQTYNPMYEGKIMSKTGEIIEGKYPNYQSIMPAKLNNYILTKFDYSRLEEINKSDKAKVMAMQDCDKKYYTPVVKIGNAYFQLELINRLVTFMRHIGTNEIYAPGESSGFVYVKSRDGWAIVCPISSRDDAYEL